MGNDTRLIIGIASGFQIANTATYIREVAAVDIAVVGSKSHTGRLLSLAHDSKTHYSFARLGDGGNYHMHDDYGYPLTAVDRHELIEAMKLDNAEGFVCRRFSLAIAVLEQFDDAAFWSSADDHIVVLQYGH